MKAKNVILVILFFVSFFSFGGEIIQGPYEISNDTGSISVEKNNNEDCHIDLKIASDNRTYVMDKLCVNGDFPNIRSVFL